MLVGLNKTGRWLFKVILFLSLPSASLAQDPWEDLIRRLVRDGEDPVYLRSLFTRPEVKYDPRIMARKLIHREMVLDYGRFLKPSALERARRYLHSRHDLLERLEFYYPTPRELLVAISLVETDLGQYLGRARIFNIFASMAASDRFDHIIPLLPEEYLAPSRVGRTKARYAEKGRWAYKELGALLRFAKANGYDPLEIKGSIFGAFGICQFLPSSAERFGVDENRDGRVDLFEEEEALASMANYLTAYGWRKDLSREAQAKVIYMYNKSKPYVETIMALMDCFGLGRCP